MKLNSAFKGRFLQFTLFLFCTLLSSTMFGSEQKIPWVLIDPEPSESVGAFEDPVVNAAFSYVSLNSKGKNFQDMFDKEALQLRKNISYCGLFGVATGCAVLTDRFIPISAVSWINTLAFSSYLYATYTSLSNYSDSSYSLQKYKKMKALLRSYLIEKLGEDNTNLIDKLNMSEEDHNILVSVLESKGYEATTQSDT